MHGKRGRGEWGGSELRVERQWLAEERQVLDSIERDAAARGQTEAGAALHCGKMASPSSDTPSAVAPSFLNRCPDSGALGPPR